MRTGLMTWKVPKPGAALLVLLTLAGIARQSSAAAQGWPSHEALGMRVCSPDTTTEACATEELQQELINMIGDGNRDAALRVIAKLNNVNFSLRPNGLIPLPFAIERGQPEIVASLLKKGADPWAKGRDGIPQLYTSIIDAYGTKPELSLKVVACVRLILEQADHQGLFSPTNPPDASAVFWLGAKKPSIDLLKLFLKYGADPTRNGWYSYEGSPLDVAIAKENLEAVRLMAGPGTHISQPELDKRAFDALVHRKTDVLVVLRSGGADPARYMNANPRVLSETVREGGIEMLSFFLKNGINLDAILFDAVSPDSSIEMLEFLLKNGANPNITKGKNYPVTPISEAQLDPEKIRILLKYGANPNSTGSNGYTILARAIFFNGNKISISSSNASSKAVRVYSKVSLVKLLLANGADPNQNNGGAGQWGALGLTRREDKDVIDLLIKRGATLRYEDIRPIATGRLTAQGADIAPPQQEPGPLTIAINVLERDDLALALLTRDGKVGPKDYHALLGAVRRGWREVTRALLQAGSDPNAMDAQGITPLAMAERRRDDILIKTLRAAGAKPSTKTAKPHYKFEGADEFDVAVANEIDEVALFDPPRFGFGISSRKVEAPFFLYGQEVNQFEQVKCERSVTLTIYVHQGEAGAISAGVCDREAKHLRELATSAKQSMGLLLDQLAKDDVKVDQQKLGQSMWAYEMRSRPDRSEIYYFPVIVVSHGILSASTVVLVSNKQDRAVVVQSSVMDHCGEEGAMHDATPLCSDPKGALIDIAQRLFTRFGEK